MMAHGKTESRLTCAGQAAHVGADYSNDEKYRNSNAIRVLEIIGQIDAEEKLDFIIAATRCLLCGNIVFSYNNGN